jgi:hypothetical protein
MQFFVPKNPKRSQTVYRSTVKPETLLHKLDEAVMSDDSETETETETGGSTTEFADTPVKQPPSKIRRIEASQTVIYNTAMMIKNAIKEHHKEEMVFPPVPSDFEVSEAEKSVPPLLYNLMAWSTGLSNEVGTDSFVKVEPAKHMKLLSILQDVMYLSSSGSTFCPKSVALGLTVRHWTGSFRVVELLNRLGHAISPMTVRRLETALAQLQIDTNEGIPMNLKRGVPTIFVADNIDFSEETISGAGTTHHTNCLAIQVAPDVRQIQEQRPETSIDKRKSTLEAPTEVVLPHHVRQQRIGPTQFNGRQDVFKLDVQWKTNPGDFAYTFMKSLQQSETQDRTQNWTGHNTLLDGGEKLKSTIAYLPVIEGSPTELDVVYVCMYT